MKYMLFLITFLSVLSGTATARLNFVDQQHLPHYNMLENPGFENGKAKWTKSGSSTFTLETSSPLFGSTSAKWDASAGSETFSSNPVTIPEGLEQGTCQAILYSRWSGGTDGHITMKVEDGSANELKTVDIFPTTETTPTTLAFSCPSGTTLIVQLESSADAAEITIDEVWLGSTLNQAVKTTPITDLKLDTGFTPDATAFGTVTNQSISKSQLGNIMFIEGVFTAGTVTANPAFVVLPSGHTVDVSGYSSGGSGRQHRIGTYTRIEAGSTVNLTAERQGAVFIDTATPTYIYFTDETANSRHEKLGADAILANSDGISFYAYVPIAEWAGSSVGLSNSQVSYLFNNDVTAGASDTTDFGYGTDGVLFSSNFAVGTEYVRRIRTLEPIQDTDNLQVEIKSLGEKWVGLMENGAIYNAMHNTTNFGIHIQRVAGSETDVDVIFATGGRRAGATYNANGDPFSDLNASGYRWRVSKSSNPLSIGSPTTNKWQIKMLTSDVSNPTTGVVTDLSYTLVAGQTYQIIFTGSCQIDNGICSVNIKDGANTIGIWKSQSGAVVTSTNSLVVERTMTDGALTFDLANNDVKLDGNNTLQETHVIVRELPYDTETSEW